MSEDLRSAGLLNYSTPINVSIGSTIQNGQVVCTLPPAIYPRFMLGFAMASPAVYPTDFIDTSGDEFNFVQFKIRGYLDSITQQNQIYNDDHLPKHPTFIRWFLAPMPVPVNTKFIWVPTNLKTTTSALTIFYITKELPHVA